MKRKVLSLLPELLDHMSRKTTVSSSAPFHAYRQNTRYTEWLFELAQPSPSTQATDGVSKAPGGRCRLCAAASHPTPASLWFVRQPQRRDSHLLKACKLLRRIPQLPKPGSRTPPEAAPLWTWESQGSAVHSISHLVDHSATTARSDRLDA